MRSEHPAVAKVFYEPKVTSFTEEDRGVYSSGQTTTLSLARALAIGCLSRLDTSLESVNIWDPTVGTGYVGFLLVDALEAAGIQVRYRGQDINRNAVEASRSRFAAISDAEFYIGDTLTDDSFKDFSADLVIVDAPWGMTWSQAETAVEERQSAGDYKFGLPSKNESIWLFISRALEKLRPPGMGGGRVAALIDPGALSSSQKDSNAVRRKIVEAGFLESITRLPDRLASNTSIPLYLATFTNVPRSGSAADVKVADLQTQFTTIHGRRSIPESALRELERALRTGKPGPRNRIVRAEQLIRSEARLSRVSKENQQLSWRLTTYNGTEINANLLESRYGAHHSISIERKPREIHDLNPSQFFEKDARSLIKDLQAKGWSYQRLSMLLLSPPEAMKHPISDPPKDCIFIPTYNGGKVATDSTEIGSTGRVISVKLEGNLLRQDFLVAWLNSEQGLASRRRAIEAASSGIHVNALRSDTNSLMRWADELIVPVPQTATQNALAWADQQLDSFIAEVQARRANVWETPDTAQEIVESIAPVFDESLSLWYEHLPYPIASALWTAETMASPTEQQRAYIHSWEAIVAFHATVLLAASRSDPGNRATVEETIRETLHQHHLGIERASFGTWVVIIERIAKELRNTLAMDDPDEEARIRSAFAGLNRSGIDRLISKEIVKKFNEVNTKRNRWLGHSGFVRDEDLREQVTSLIADLRELHRLYGNVWSQLLLVRAGSLDVSRDGIVQDVEVAVGTRSPFKPQRFTVGETMLRDELYLVRNGAQSPLPLGPFVQLKSAPSDAQYTSYFYNRTEGENVRLISYQYGSETELQVDVANFRNEFGNLLR